MLLYKKCTTWKAPTREAKRYGAFSSPKLYERIQKILGGSNPSSPTSFSKEEGPLLSISLLHRTGGVYA
jgi:hypothetical protein